jgi:hypothetical protein
MKIKINRDEQSYVITTPVDIVDDDNKEFSCIVETRITSVGGMPITDREIIWNSEEPENREEVEQKILEEVGTNPDSRS